MFRDAPAVDLFRNTVDGRRCRPQVCELAAILVDGKPRRTNDIIARLYGVAEPEDAANAVKQAAFLARQAGVPIRGVAGRRGGYYRMD